MARTKARLFSIIGDHCVQCGIDDHRVLTVHHTDNNGASHRRLISNGGRGYPFYLSVLRSGEFDSLSTLCFSCNVNAEWLSRKSKVHSV
jgi:hypothetical protein